MIDLVKIGNRIINLRHVVSIHLNTDGHHAEPNTVRFMLPDGSTVQLTGHDAHRFREWVEFNVHEGGIWDVANDVND